MFAVVRFIQVEIQSVVVLIEVYPSDGTSEFGSEVSAYDTLHHLHLK